MAFGFTITFRMTVFGHYPLIHRNAVFSLAILTKMRSFPIRQNMVEMLEICSKRLVPICEFAMEMKKIVRNIANSHNT